ncbi:uncharacterized protein LOC126982998 [Eriocheir sinensis]|uniref:uncharacterized protein LOC126982998 n=1 Tax=Eriocheir sinensis TaxID=95602 RepID=UPI0021C6523F|nr:uncharacterized protein LOC126982998 [Eriocheir sinensis]
MKFLVVMCLLAAGANAQFGKHGIIMPDGNNVQFTHEQSENILLIGPSGAITADGKHVQLDRDGLPRTKREVALQGPSGVLFTDGQKRHLPPGVEIVLLTESGAVLSNGNNVQFRKKRSSGPLIDAITGPSGFITPTSQLFHLPAGVTVAIMGDTGALLSDGTAIQFFESRLLQRSGSRRGTRCLYKRGGGIVPHSSGSSHSGVLLNLTSATMKFLVVMCLLAAGANAQFGKHGIIMPDGNNVQFTHEQSENILLIGPSGAITADGKHVQLDRDGLPRTKREVALKGPSGVLFTDGQKRHLPPGVEIVLLTESGAVLSNGNNVQFRKKRSSGPLIDAITGPSGFITPTSQLFHLPAGVTVAIMGDTGALLSDGTAIQFFE